MREIMTFAPRANLLDLGPIAACSLRYLFVACLEESRENLENPDAMKTFIAFAVLAGL